MRIPLVIFCFLTSSFAWFGPERCDQGKTKRVRRFIAAAVTSASNTEESNIENTAAKQNALLKETYKKFNFESVPIRAECRPNTDPSPGIFVYGPYNCSFHTYRPRLLSSVDCQSSACKLIHTVSTMDTYTSSEGFNWGTKISTKFSFGKIFEVGGEVSTGKTYTCTYTKGRTTTDTVECSESSGNNGHLQLYNVKSDLQCDFGSIKMENDKRNGRFGDKSEKDYFTKGELREIKNSPAIFITASGFCLTENIIDLFSPKPVLLLDTNKISDRLFQKIMNKMPDFNPYTDIVMVDESENSQIMVRYLKKGIFNQEYTKVIPFTTEGGDSIFQYGCMFTHV